jgi:murein DD-endopeptidase MepM/ murein hydrolase activator NlpD
MKRKAAATPQGMRLIAMFMVAGALALALWAGVGLLAGPAAAQDIDHTAATPTPDQAPLTPRYPSFIARSAVPHTTIPDRPRLEIITYTVQPGDTVFGIAEQFHISPETIMWSNGDLEQHPDDLYIGQMLTILPVSGVYYKVAAGDTVESIAKKFSAKSDDIVKYELNRLKEGQEPVAGQMLIVPGGEKPYVPRYVSHYTGPIPAGSARGTGSFGWPVSGYITQRYWSQHRALDIGAPAGTPVYASDSGYVVFAGWDNSGYGNLIVIDHGNGFITYYAHLIRIAVRVGDSVGKGQQIGAVGSTGHSTGPHLHFEIQYRGVQRNPATYLP